MCAQISRVARATVDVSVSLVGVVGVIGRSPPANEVGAIVEHITGSGGCGRAPFVTHINTSQLGATIKHPTHVGNLGRVKTAQVKTCQTRTLKEHVPHVCHLSGVEIA